MKIVAPVSRASEVKPVIEAGADEIYCGLLTNEQSDNYVNANCLNRRSEISSNLTSYEDLEEVIQIAHKKNIAVNFTLNEFYNQAQIAVAIRQLEKVMELGIDSVIVSDLGLLHKIRQRGYPDLKLHISSCASILNSEAMRFYKIFEPSRIILNRQLTLSEMRHIKKNFPDLEIEVIILNERCYYIDGLCTFMHGKFSPTYNIFKGLILRAIYSKNIEYLPSSILQKAHIHVSKNNHCCCFPYTVMNSPKERKTEERIRRDKIFFNEANYFLEACGICAIYDFHNMGIKSLKISGRTILTRKTKNVKLVKEVITIAQQELRKDDFCKKVKDLARRRYSRACSPQYCYY